MSLVSPSRTAPAIGVKPLRVELDEHEENLRRLRTSKSISFVAKAGKSKGRCFPQFHSQIFRDYTENCVDTDEATV